MYVDKSAEVNEVNALARETVLGNQRGMSLMEILIVISLMAVVGTIAATKILDSLEEGKRGAAKTQIAEFKSMMQNFYRLCNQFPTTEQGLDALAAKPTSGPDCANYPSGGIIADGKVPMDPWGHPYVYESPDGGKSYVITAFPKTGQPPADGAGDGEKPILSTDL
jgi:general secretion pathway protein G